MCWQEQAIDVIDDILEIILKADKWQLLADSLNTALLGNWNNLQKRAIEEAIEYVTKAEGEFHEEDIKDLLDILEKRLGKDLAEACRSAVSDHQLKAYKQAFKAIDGKSLNVQFSFNKVSKDTLAWMEENETYWIGKRFSTDIRPKLDKSLNEVGKGILESGLGRDDAGKLLKETCQEFFQKPEGYQGSINNYFKGLSNHITTRAREFGRIDAYDRAGIKYAKIVAVMDYRTSKICRHMNGRVIPVDHLREVRSKLTNATTPEKAKSISNWIKESEVEGLVKDKSTEDLLKDKKTKGLASPPFHFSCRSLTVAATEEEFNTQEETRIVNDPQTLTTAE